MNIFKIMDITYFLLYAQFNKFCLLKRKCL
jgi:hypothetical protein